MHVFWFYVEKIFCCRKWLERADWRPQPSLSLRSCNKFGNLSPIFFDKLDIVYNFSWLLYYSVTWKIFFLDGEVKMASLIYRNRVINVKTTIQLCCNIKYVQIFVKILKLKYAYLLKKLIKWNNFFTFK